MVKTQEYPVITKKHLALIAPLDWGLGHTTRCIPIIAELTKNNFEIVIACNSIQKSVLGPEFPDALFINLEGYNLKYGSSRFLTITKLFLQLPKILISIKQENLQLKRILTQFSPNIIISDNRYGVFSSSIPSIFITHQLDILTGTGVLNNRIARFVTHKLIGRFSECWVPDFDTGFKFAGRLSRAPASVPFRVRYIGALSRFHTCGTTTLEEYILVVLSGPEPQRSRLEEILLRQLAATAVSVILVRGVPPDRPVPVTGSNITMINFSSGKALNALICGAKYVVSRSGYTSIMDLLKLRKKTILIPTPGQAEQEYLARYLSQQNIAVACNQASLDIEQCINAAADIKLPPQSDMNFYKTAISDSIKRLVGVTV